MTFVEFMYKALEPVSFHLGWKRVFGHSELVHKDGSRAA